MQAAAIEILEERNVLKRRLEEVANGSRRRTKRLRRGTKNRGETPPRDDGGGDEDTGEEGDTPAMREGVVRRVSKQYCLMYCLFLHTEDELEHIIWHEVDFASDARWPMGDFAMDRDIRQEVNSRNLRVAFPEEYHEDLRDLKPIVCAPFHSITTTYPEIYLDLQVQRRA
jgi:hypothetical protein